MLSASRGEARTVFVVGGASGIGLASATLLGQKGWRVVIGDRNADALDRAREVLDAEGIPVILVDLDVSDPSSVNHAFDKVSKDYGIDSLVNAAGILQMGTILDVDESEWNKILNVNLSGIYRTCRRAVEHMVAQGGGTIVNLASQSGRTASFYTAPNYVASKAGIIGITMAIAAQHAHQGVRANAVAPGLVETPLIATVYTDQQRERMTAATPLGRFASAGEVAQVVAFLASDESSYMTGQTLNVNGGSFMQ
jgi:NAD(P)-dependent dehydrogenase (short-subunit alcohol dehydrogenase family)